MTYALILGNILMAVVFALFFNRLPPQIPLFPSKIWGEDQLGEIWMIFIIPVLMNSFYIINNFLIKKIFSENQYIKNVFLYLNLGVVTIFTFIFLKIILAVI